MNFPDTEVNNNNVVYEYQERFLTLLELYVIKYCRFLYQPPDLYMSIYHQGIKFIISPEELYINGKLFREHTWDELANIQGQYIIGRDPAKKQYYFHFMDQTLIISNNQERATFPITIDGIIKAIESGIVKNIVVPPNFDTSKLPSVPIVSG